jgi:DNA-binding CsgD family transcriptional regulator
LLERKEDVQLLRLEHAPLTGAVMSAYRGFVGALDAEEPEKHIDKAISAIAPIDRFYVSERAEPTRRPHLIAHRLEGGLANRMRDYMDRYFLRDPVAEAIAAAHRDGPTVILRVGPEDIAETEYRRSFYDEAEIVERVSFVHRTSDRWFIMNVARRAPSPMFNEQELGALASLSLLLLPLAARHGASALTNRRPAGLSIEQLEERFMEKFPMLSPRERQVCARTAVGMTSEATALDLGVGIGSVQTYRKRAFQRLEISTAFQLAHLVMH